MFDKLEAVEARFLKSKVASPIRNWAPNPTSFGDFLKNTPHSKKSLKSFGAIAHSLARSNPIVN